MDLAREELKPAGDWNCISQHSQCDATGAHWSDVIIERHRCRPRSPGLGGKWANHAWKRCTAESAKWDSMAWTLEFTLASDAWTLGKADQTRQSSRWSLHPLESGLNKVSCLMFANWIHKRRILRFWDQLLSADVAGIVIRAQLHGLPELMLCSIWL